MTHPVQTFHPLRPRHPDIQFQDTSVTLRPALYLSQTIPKDSMHPIEPYDQSSGDQIELLHQKLATLDQHITAEPDEPAAYRQRGVIQGQLGDHLAAIKDFDIAIRLDSSNAEAFYNRGMAYIYLRQHAGAIDDFTKAIERNPDHIDAYNNRAGAYYETGHPQEALEDANRILERESNKASAYAIRALAHTQLGYDEAAQTDKNQAQTYGFDEHVLDFLIRQEKRHR